MDKLLARSAEFEEVLFKYLSSTTQDTGARMTGVKSLCGVAMEHAQSLKILIATHNFTSASALLRLQYEALVRAHWLHFAASETAVSKLSAELTKESSIKANNIPMLSEMLKSMEGKAPKEALEPLLEFRDYSWKPLSSFIHGGIHPMSRFNKGYPIVLLETVLKNSNQLCGVTAYFWSHMTGISELTANVMRTFAEYKDCVNYTKNTNA